MKSTKDSNKTRCKAWVGWIAAVPEDRLFLEKLGVQINGPYDDFEKHFNVYMSEDTFSRLDPYWGRFVWSLKEYATDN